MEHFVCFILSYYYFLFLVDHKKNKKIKKKKPKESINRSRRLEKEGGAKLWKREKRKRGRRESS